METPILSIIYQDENIIAINKPHGIAVHASKMYKYDTVFILQTLRDQIGQKVYPAHRLDKKTSGVLLFSLSETMNIALQGMFLEKKMHKIYHALVRGFIQETGRIDYALKNNEKKIQNAITDYKPLNHFEINVPSGKHESSRYSLIEMQAQTGRFHQLRKHFAHIRHPIIGDRPHGCNKQNRLWKEKFLHDTMLLHAKSLEFQHPLTNEKIVVEAPYTKEFIRAFEILEIRKMH